MHTCCGRLFADQAAHDTHVATLHPHPYRVLITSSYARDLAELVEYARAFSADKRKSAAKSGSAMGDGSFPIENVQDLKNAIKAVGRASNPASAKAHIKKRAKALGKENLLPDDWASNITGPVSTVADVIVNPNADQQGLPYACPYCDRRFAEQAALDLHEDLSHKDVREGQSSGAPDGPKDASSQEQAEKPDSWNDIQSLVREALIERYRDPMQNYCYIWIADIGPDWVVFEFKDEYYRTEYAVDDNGRVSFSGRPVEVIRRTIYQPVPTDVDEENDGDPDDASLATGHNKKKNGSAQPSHIKDGKAQNVSGNKTANDIKLMGLPPEGKTTRSG